MKQRIPRVYTSRVQTTSSTHRVQLLHKPITPRTVYADARCHTVCHHSIILILAPIRMNIGTPTLITPIRHGTPSNVALTLTLLKQATHTTLHATVVDSSPSRRGSPRPPAPPGPRAPPRSPPRCRHLPRLSDTRDSNRQEKSQTSQQGRENTMWTGCLGEY
jgi:hypothetical protein